MRGFHNDSFRDSFPFFGRCWKPRSRDGASGLVHLVLNAMEFGAGSYINR